MTAIKRFKEALQIQQVDDEVTTQIFEGSETISDRSPKPKKAAFFAQAVELMDNLLDASESQAIRAACACSTGGWLTAAALIAFAFIGRQQVLREEKKDRMRS
jgi:hypothetical protein